MTTPVDAAADRHRRIADRLDAVGRVDVGELALRLDVAQETIRRDLRVLEQQGILERVHGGAVRRTERPLSPFDGSTPAHAAEHLQVAQMVVDRLPTRGTLLIGTSNLTWAVAEALSRRDSAGTGLTVVTTSLDVAVVLSRVDSLPVFNTGGSVDQQSRAQQGDWTLTEIARFRVDLALLPASGIDVAAGIFAADPMAAAVAAAMASASSKVWVLIDGDAFGSPCGVRAADISSVEHIYVAGHVDAARSAPFLDVGIAVAGTS